jgi:hypothetical protein
MYCTYVHNCTSNTWRSSILKCSNNEVSSSTCPPIAQILRNSCHYSHVLGPIALLSFRPLILPPHLRSSNLTVYSSLHTYIHPDNLLILVFTLPHRLRCLGDPSTDQPTRRQFDPHYPSTQWTVCCDNSPHVTFLNLSDPSRYFLSTPVLRWTVCHT